MYLPLTVFGILSSVLVYPLLTLFLTKFFVSGDLDKTKKEMLVLKKQLLQISAQDEFAKWAKLKRKSENLAKDYSALNASNSFYSNTISWTLLVVTKIALLYILYVYWDYPVFTVNKSMLGVFTPWLAWPFSPEGSVSPFYVVSSASFVFWKLLSCVKYK
jgi:uncharacterized membrane protein (DUF106 family)